MCDVCRSAPDWTTSSGRRTNFHGGGATAGRGWTETTAVPGANIQPSACAGCRQAGDDPFERRRAPMDERWFKQAVIYSLDVETYQDSNGDGVGDLSGLIGRLDYLA